MVAYAPTEEATEGRMAKYMAALNSTVTSVSTREYVFGLIDASARTGKRSEGGGGSDIMGEYDLDVLNENGNCCWVSEKTTRSLF